MSTPPEKAPDKLAEPLPNGGLQILTDLITHQDSATWTALSVFLAAEFVLLTLYIQKLPAPDWATLGTLGMFGVATTVASHFIVKRSERYLEEYYKLAKQRSHPQDLDIFNIQIKDIPQTSKILRIVHFAFGVLWVILTVGYLLILPVLLRLLIH